MGNTSKHIVTFILIIIAALAAGCSGDGGGDDRGMPAVTPPVNQSGIRNFTRSELDTLRAIKARCLITRDEYWDDRGGVLGNEFMELWYPPGKLTVSHATFTFDHLMIARREVQKMFGVTPAPTLTVITTQTMDAYTEYTGRQWWHYSKLEHDRIIYQPVPILVSRGVIDQALPREYYEWAIASITDGRAPRWIQEGLASVLVFEEKIITENIGEFPTEPVKLTVQDIEKVLEVDDNKMRSRIAYYNAFRMVRLLDDELGRNKLEAMVTAMAEGKDVDAAAQEAYQMSYTDLVTRALDWPDPHGSDN